jgi:hypothetical protein
MDEAPNNIQHEEILTLFRITIEDIERTKQHQWKIFYYTVVSEGGLLYLFEKCFSNQRCLFFVLTILLCAVGSYLVGKSQDDIEKFRERKINQLSFFHPVVRKTMDNTGEKSNIHRLLIFTIIVVSLLFSYYYLKC